MMARGTDDAQLGTSATDKFLAVCLWSLGVPWVLIAFVSMVAEIVIYWPGSPRSDTGALLGALEFVLLALIFVVPAYKIIRVRHEYTDWAEWTINVVPFAIIGSCPAMLFLVWTVIA